MTKKKEENNAITSQFIFNRDVWLEKSKIRENRRFSEVLSTPMELKEEREEKKK
jgi:hypothetical protein